MIDIKDFPEGTNLQYLYTAPITDYYNKKLPVMFSGVNSFNVFEKFIKDIYNRANVTVPLFFDKLDFSEVEYIYLASSISHYPLCTSENLVLDLPKIKKIDISNIQFTGNGARFSTVTLNCGEDFEYIRNRPDFSSSYPGIFTLNSNSKKITMITQVDFDYLTEMHINCDCEKLTEKPYNMVYSDNKTLTFHSGFPNCKYESTSYYYDKLPNLTYQSIMSIINNLYDFRGNGDTTTTRTLKIHSNTMALLSDEDKALAINKGWVLIS